MRKAVVVVPGRRQDVRTSSNRVGPTGRSAREVTTIDLNGKSPEMSQSQSQRITEQEGPAQLNDEKGRGLENRARLAVKSMLGNSSKVTKRSRHTKEMRANDPVMTSIAALVIRRNIQLEGT